MALKLDRFSLDRALTLSERDRLFSGSDTGEGSDAALAAKRLDRWRSETALADDRLFSLRLEQQGLALPLFTRLLTAPPPSAADEPWARFLDAAYSESDSPTDNGLPVETAAAQDDAVFLDIVRPILDHGWRELNRRLGALDVSWGEVRSENFAHLWSQSLPSYLLAMVSRTLILELYVQRLEGSLEGDTPEARFHDFVTRHSRPDGARELWERYPVLARAVAERTLQWLEVGIELASRLLTDLPDLTTTLGIGGDLTSLSSGLGDRHAGGRTVVRLAFASGTRVIYKPRSLALDVTFQQLLAWLSEQGVEPRLRTLRVLDRETHGWVEHVDEAPCADLAGIRRFYERQGIYLALLYALEATDFHHENLIAAGEHPVLIDLETLLQPILLEEGASREDRNPAASTVLRSGLLPRPAWGVLDGEDLDLSGLGARSEEPTPMRVLSRIGTDEMGFVDHMYSRPMGRHRPSLAPANGGDGSDDEIALWDYGDVILASFEDTYRKLVELRPAFLEPGGWLDRFAGAETRVIVRPTGLYVRLLHLAYHPDHLQDGLDRDRLYDKLWFDAERFDHVATVLPAERQAMWRGDVPRFLTRTDSRDLWTCSGERLPDFLPGTGLDQTRERFREMGDDDLQRQLALARLSLAAHRPYGVAHVPSERPPSLADHAPEPLPTAEDFLQAAAAVGERLELLSFHAGSWRSWFHLRGGEERSALEPVGPDLYAGLGGIAIFYGALGAWGPSDRRETATRIARETLSTARERLESWPAFHQRIGGFDGLGGWIYTLTYLGALWSDGALFDEAEAARDRLADAVADDEGLDVIAGSAGAIAALLALHQHRASPETLAAAVACGEHLLDRAEPQEHGHAWVLPKIAERPLTGFAHGAAGIAWALARLATATGREDFAAAARDGLAYERSLFRPDRDNWPDLRLDRRVGDDWGYLNAWCHGAPGIGLGRLDLLERWSGDELSRQDREAEIHAALRTTRATGFGGNHCLCHGDLGNLELLTRGARVLGDDEAHREAHDLAARILAGIEHHGPRSGITSAVELPGLLTGLAGIGYGLLRLGAAETGSVPSVLLLETPDGSHSSRSSASRR